MLLVRKCTVLYTLAYTCSRQRLAQTATKKHSTHTRRNTRHAPHNTPQYCQKLEACLSRAAGSDGCAVGPRLSLADVIIYNWATTGLDDKEAAAQAWAACPRLRAVVDRAGREPGIQAWVARRPATAF
jgi:glutathione S-transferase